MTDENFAKAVLAEIPLAERLFHDLRELSKDDIGVTRASYGTGEQAAHDLMAETARSLELEVKTDYAGNLYMTLAGTDRRKPSVISGSHLDSVPKGGNYDGAAGVVAGLTALAGLRRIGFNPASDITIMATRGEESAWFAVHHIGSRAALGLLTPAELDTARRVDTGRSLGEHISDLGFNVEALRRGERYLEPARIRSFFELHIEQGPVLEHEDYPIGIVTGIRGNVRARHARCLGSYAHSGAVPRKMRHDAVMAMAEYVNTLESEWEAIEAAGGDLVLTFGKFHTDFDVHTHNKVPGEMLFTIDVRSHDQGILDRLKAAILDEAERIGAARGVEIDIGAVSRVKPAVMDGTLRNLLAEGCDRLKLNALDIPSGGGHDAGDFAGAGVPSAMIFVRNPKGSHNPDEDMEIEDFAKGTELLAWALAETSSR